MKVAWLAQIWTWPLARKKKIGSDHFAPAQASHSACYTQWPPCFLIEMRDMGALNGL